MISEVTEETFIGLTFYIYKIFDQQNLQATLLQKEEYEPSVATDYPEVER